MMLEDEIVHRVYEVRTIVIWITSAIVSAVIVLIGRRSSGREAARRHQESATAL